MTSIIDMSVDELEILIKYKRAEQQQAYIEQMRQKSEEASELQRELNLLPGVAAANFAIDQAIQARAMLPGVAELERQIRNLRSNQTYHCNTRSTIVLEEALKYRVNFMSTGNINGTKTLAAYLNRMPTNSEVTAFNQQLKVNNIR